MNFGRIKDRNRGLLLSVLRYKLLEFVVFFYEEKLGTRLGLSREESLLLLFGHIVAKMEKDINVFQTVDFCKGFDNKRI